MKHFLLAIFVIVLIACQYYWFRLRKALTPMQKRWDLMFNSQADVITLLILLLGYLFIVWLPYMNALMIYFAGAMILGLGLMWDYEIKLRFLAASNKFIKWSLFYFGVQYFSTVTLGFLLIVLYNVV